MKNITLLYCIIFGFIWFQPITAQELEQGRKYIPPDLRVGITGAFTSVSHTATFTGADIAQSCCGQYNSVTSAGIMLGIMAEKPLDNMFSLQVRAQYSMMPATFTANEFIGYSQQQNSSSGGSTLIPVRSNFTLKTNLAVINLTPLFVAEPFSFPLRIQIGGDIGVVAGKSYDQNETLEQSAVDAGVRFSDNSTSFNSQTEKAMTLATPMFFAGRGMLAYRYDVSPTLSIIPEAGYMIGFSNSSTQGTWKQSGAFGGLSVAYNLGVELLPCEKCYTRDINGDCVPKPCPPSTILNEDCDCVAEPLPICPDNRVYNVATKQCDCPPNYKEVAGKCIDQLHEDIGMHSVLVAKTSTNEAALNVVGKLKEKGFNTARVQTIESGRTTQYRIIVEDVGTTPKMIALERDRIIDAIDEYCRTNGIKATYERYKKGE